MDLEECSVRAALDVIGQTHRVPAAHYRERFHLADLDHNQFFRVTAHGQASLKQHVRTCLTLRLSLVRPVVRLAEVLDQAVPA